MLFEPPHDELSDEEIAAVFRHAVASAGRLPRSADLLLAGLCAEHLVNCLRLAGLKIVRPRDWQLHQ